MSNPEGEEDDRNLDGRAQSTEEKALNDQQDSNLND
jgi:hypothetical protein